MFSQSIHPSAQCKKKEFRCMYAKLLDMYIGQTWAVKRKMEEIRNRKDGMVTFRMVIVSETHLRMLIRDNSHEIAVVEEVCSKFTPCWFGHCREIESEGQC